MDPLESDAFDDVTELAAFGPVPRTGVIYVTVEAQERGFDLDAPGWCNLGQGQPDTGELPGAPERVRHIEVRPEDLDYAPVPGVTAYEELLDVFRRFLPIPILLDPKDGYECTSADLEEEILGVDAAG